MRRTLITLCSLFLAVLTLTSCEDQLNIMFKDFYVCIKDSNNTDKSANSQDLISDSHSLELLTKLLLAFPLGSDEYKPENHKEQQQHTDGHDIACYIS